jgi:hypothetical protein
MRLEGQIYNPGEAKHLLRAIPFNAFCKTNPISELKINWLAN